MTPRIKLEELDPDYDWIDVTTASEEPGTQFVRGGCKHLRTDNVETLENPPVVVGMICLNCEVLIEVPAGDR